MKKIIIILVCLIVFPVIGSARDYIVDCLAENYNEETEDYKHHLQIYHSIQINSIAGKKILVLKGDNFRYRTWLREYIANSKKLMIKIDDKDNNNFISSKVYIIDVASVYSVNDNIWGSDSSTGKLKIISDKKHILIVDNNIKRRKLLKQIINDVGYSVTFLENSQEALRVFKIQPENFLMVIANYDIQGFKKMKFVETLENLSPETPIIVGGAYKNKKINDRLFNDFARMDNVIVKPVILENLSRTIIKSLKK